MNIPVVDQIAKAVLYEGYMLYPYRPSAIKNQQRWNFGVLYPEAYEEVKLGSEKCSMRVECLLAGSERTRVRAAIRFLHLSGRLTLFQSGQGSLPPTWQEANEREVELPQRLVSDLSDAFTMPFEFPAELRTTMLGRDDLEDQALVVHQQEALGGTVELKIAAMRPGLFKVGVSVRNRTHLADWKMAREEALLRSMVSAHVVLQLEEGHFVSLLDPPDELRELATNCKNIGAWPVLVGDRRQRDTILASPIILYDYPQIAPESAGDLFDGTEIDEILSLRIMTLTDEEKQEIRNGDDRAREILERTDAMPAEQFLKLHGVVRGMRPVDKEQR